MDASEQIGHPEPARKARGDIEQRNALTAVWVVGAALAGIELSMGALLHEQFPWNWLIVLFASLLCAGAGLGLSRLMIRLALRSVRVTAAIVAVLVYAVGAAASSMSTWLYPSAIDALGAYGSGCLLGSPFDPDHHHVTVQLPPGESGMVTVTSQAQRSVRFDYHEGFRADIVPADQPTRSILKDLQCP